MSQDTLSDDELTAGDYGLRQQGGLIVGLLLLAAAFLAPSIPGLTLEASKVAYLALTMAVLWVTEALPIPATALLPLIMLPLLGVSTIKEAAPPYADPVLYLFMGGFILSLAMERWSLHRRIALHIIAMVGTKPRSLVLGFLLASALLSMWMSNTATAMMMLPIGVSVYQLVKEGRKEGAAEFGGALVLAIAYGANIGGIATPIGTPPNAIFKAFMEKSYGVEIGFLQWMLVGVPLVLIALPVVHLILTRLSFKVENVEAKGVREGLNAAMAKLGRMTWPEYAVAGAFLLAITLWVSHEAWKDLAPNITDEVISVGAALLLFIIPVDWKRGIFVMDWDTMKKFPWDVIVLFGGGLSLAAAFEKTKLAITLANAMQGMSDWPMLGVIFLVTGVMIATTALTSNSASTTALLPVAAALAVGMGQPVILLTMPLEIAASADFMLPVGTPPNAIAFGSKLISLPRMVKAGFWVDVLFIVLIPLTMWTLGRWAFVV
jgi:solute carrier family 13 (sodium-dependent dicarboxylate transporter), member 2/3/5